MNIPAAMFLSISGLFVGSFLNVLVDRLPKDENPFTGRSHCEYCKKTLAWYDLIPLLSFVSTQGKCRYCRKRLSLFYPLIELTTALLFVLTLNTFGLIGGGIYLTYYLFLVSVLIVVFFSDLRYGIIPDKIVFPAIIVSLVYLFLGPQSIFFDHLISAVLVFAFFLAIFLLTKGRAMGFGDVKFALLLGLVLGPINSILALYVAFLTGAGVGLILILWKKKHLKYAIAFGPFLVLGFLTSFFFAPQILPKVLALF